jgi:uncharacterized membrane-anchored protein
MSKMFNSGGISNNPSDGSFKAYGWGLAIVVLGGILALAVLFASAIIQFLMQLFMAAIALTIAGVIIWSIISYFSNSNRYF